jgi:hypothetical protein
MLIRARLVRVPGTEHILGQGRQAMAGSAPTPNGPCRPVHPDLGFPSLFLALGPSLFVCPLAAVVDWLGVMVVS